MFWFFGSTVISPPGLNMIGSFGIIAGLLIILYGNHASVNQDKNTKHDTTLAKENGDMTAHVLDHDHDDNDNDIDHNEANIQTIKHERE